MADTTWLNQDCMYQTHRLAVLETRWNRRHPVGMECMKSLFHPMNTIPKRRTEHLRTDRGRLSRSDKECKSYASMTTECQVDRQY